MLYVNWGKADLEACDERPIRIISSMPNGFPNIDWVPYSVKGLDEWNLLNTSKDASFNCYVDDIIERALLWTSSLGIKSSK